MVTRPWKLNTAWFTDKFSFHCLAPLLSPARRYGMYLWSLDAFLFRLFSMKASSLPVSCNVKLTELQMRILLKEGTTTSRQKWNKKRAIMHLPSTHCTSVPAFYFGFQLPKKNNVRAHNFTQIYQVLDCNCTRRDVPMQISGLFRSHISYWIRLKSILNGH
jgi:hypothetical protein